MFGHGGVDSRKLGIGTSFSPGHHAVDAALAYKWTARVPLKQQDRRKHQGWLDVPRCFLESHFTNETQRKGRVIFYIFLPMKWPKPAPNSTDRQVLFVLSQPATSIVVFHCFFCHWKMSTFLQLSKCQVSKTQRKNTEVLLPDRRPFRRCCNQHRACFPWSCRRRTRCCCIFQWRRWGAWQCGGWRGSGLLPGWCIPSLTPGTLSPPLWRRRAGAAERWTRNCSDRPGPSTGEMRIDSVVSEGRKGIQVKDRVQWFCGLHLYKHDVVVVGGAVVVRVGNQKLGHDLLLRSLIDGQRIVTRHDHHSVNPAERKRKLETPCCKESLCDFYTENLGLCFCLCGKK